MNSVREYSHWSPDRTAVTFLHCKAGPKVGRTQALNWGTTSMIKMPDDCGTLWRLLDVVRLPHDEDGTENVTTLRSFGGVRLALLERSKRGYVESKYYFPEYKERMD